MRTLLLAASCSAICLAFAPAHANPTPPKPIKKVSKAKSALPVEPPEPETLDDERMAVVPRVLVGDSQCEFGRSVRVDPHPSLAGRFMLTLGKQQHILTPQPTSTGVIRLENAKAGLVWLQVPIKSMLMNAKLGQRLADNCLHTAQTAELEAMKAAELAQAESAAQ
ncbi:MAG: hypothetical protein U1E77_15090 [Inhella sp.]